MLPHSNTAIFINITFFINNLNILSILIVKWKQLNKERIPDDDQ